MVAGSCYFTPHTQVTLGNMRSTNKVAADVSRGVSQGNGGLRSVVWINIGVWSLGFKLNLGFEFRSVGFKFILRWTLDWGYTAYTKGCALGRLKIWTIWKPFCDLTWPWWPIIPHRSSLAFYDPACQTSQEVVMLRRAVLLWRRLNTSWPDLQRGSLWPIHAMTAITWCLAANQAERQYN